MYLAEIACLFGCVDRANLQTDYPILPALTEENRESLDKKILSKLIWSSGVEGKEILKKFFLVPFKQV